ncbi:MAG TPA: glycosyltransferase family 2 protein [Hyphomicrobiaceae bacterium]|nr:glycosyltransferase family 2 protein [Hyphomicrobiaceae bacterium]
MNPRTAGCALSLVAPCYNEELGLAEFHRRAAAAVRAAAADDYEIVLVDDGSSDGTWAAIEALSGADPHVVGVRLMRNHGHQLAATAGLAVSRGRRVVLIDADLQDPPELIADMMALMDAGADVVYGKRSRREGESWFKTASAAAFYRLLSRLASVPIPEDTGDFRLMSRRVVDALLAMPERERFIRGMVSWIGGRQVPLHYERKARLVGASKYPLAKMLRFAADAITSFSIVPLRIASWLGIAVAGIALLLLLYTVWQWAAGNVVAGWSSTMTAIALFAGVQLIVLGIIGEYLGRLVHEAKGRPLYLIDEIARGGESRPVPIELSRLSPAARAEVVATLTTVATGSPAPAAKDSTAHPP